MSTEEINIVATMYPKADKHDELISHLRKLSEQVLANEPGTLVYYFFDVADKNEIIAIEKYKNQAALEAHATTTYMNDFVVKAPELTEKAAVIKTGSYIGGFETRSSI